MADDLGLETMGSYGGTSYKTPNLDRLAAKGARFEHCYAQPICTPSRVQLMTGQYNVRNYVKFGLLPRGEILGNDDATVETLHIPVASQNNLTCRIRAPY